ncbi:T9SS type A sorting domain-containing protein [Hymenobacter gummosus]|uniref:T9SS type A sorting domain-containing protein n=1 Tax=Hymenobacter gummosus TaxID=1776032 RepID=A0A3S0JET0_9BACT|nr:FG-GAP-like repeat-containing protein [Hymenobacter gummosus]RTQ50265.1 T9SS type A sorting domain-containing protein [Hymenobacter gummosus]
MKHLRTPKSLGPSTVLSAGLLLISSYAAAQHVVTALSPARNAVAAPVSTPISVTASSALPATGPAQLHVFSQQARGKRTGPLATSGNTLTLSPGSAFRPGETVQATLLGAANGGTVAQGQVWQFTAATTGGTGTFGSPTRLNLGLSPAAPRLADFDGDGDLDILSSEQNQPTGISLWLNNGSGTFSSIPAPPVNPNSTASALAVGDVNGDGRPDALIPNSTSTPTLPFHIKVFFGNGDGTFLTGPNVPIGNTNPASIQLADADADGDLDMFVLTPFPSSQTSYVTVLLNSGTGSFTSAGDVPVTIQPTALALGDVDNDGDVDFTAVSLVATNPTPVTIALNDGSGSFTPTPMPWTAGSFQAVNLADIDGDGDLDWLGTSYGTVSGVIVRRNNGSGSFGAPTTVAAGTDPRASQLGDVDGDGDLDLIASSWQDQSLQVRLNDGAGNFSGSGQAVAGAYLNTLTMGDLDNDGDLDALVTSNWNATSGGYVLLNQNRPLATQRPRLDATLAWPNPVAAGQPLRLTHAGPAHYRLTTALGQLVRQQAVASTATDIPTAGLAPGLYLLSVSTPNAAPAVQRVVIQ